MSATQWLTDSKVFWTGVPGAIPESDEAWTPLRGLIQARLAALPRGVYALSVTYPDPIQKAPGEGRPRPVVDPEVDRLTALSRQTLAETARAVSLAVQFPVVLRKRLGDVGAWRERCEHALREVSVLLRAADGASDLASLLALEEGCVVIGAGPAPSASVDLDALAEWLRSQQGATAPGVRVAAVILGQRGRADGVPHRLAEWSRLGRALTQWPPSYVLSIARALDGAGAGRPGDALETLNTSDIRCWLDEVMLGQGSGPAPEDILGLCELLKALDRVRHEPLRRLRIAAALRCVDTRTAGHAEAAGSLGEAVAAVGVPAPIAYGRSAPAPKGTLQRWVILPRELPERLRAWLPQGLHTRGMLRCMERGDWQAAMALLEEVGTIPDPQGPVTALVLAGRLSARGVAHASDRLAGWVRTCSDLAPLLGIWDAVFHVFRIHSLSGWPPGRIDNLLSVLASHGESIALIPQHLPTRAREVATVASAGIEALELVQDLDLWGWVHTVDEVEALTQWLGPIWRSQSASLRDEQPRLPWRLDERVLDSRAPLASQLRQLGTRLVVAHGLHLRRVVSLMSEVAGQLGARTEDEAALAAWLGKRQALVERVLCSEADDDAERNDTVCASVLACAFHWEQAGFANADRMATRVLSRRVAKSWSRDELELAVLLSGGDIPRLLILLDQQRPDAGYQCSALSGWRLLAEMPRLRGHIRTCAGKPELFTRVTRTLERMALLNRLQPGGQLARDLGVLEADSPSNLGPPSFLAPDVAADLQETSRYVPVLPSALSDVLDSATRLAQEATVLRRRLAAGTLSERQQARLKAVEALLADSQALHDRVNADLRKALRKQLPLAALTGVATLVDSSLDEYYERILGGPPPADVDPRDLDTAFSLLPTLETNSGVLRRLLRHSDGGGRGWVAAHPANQRFLARMRDAGLDPDAWTATRVVSVATRTGELTAYVETAPLRVLQMGALFHTCLGSFNAHGAVSAAVELNKRVLYVKDARGTIVGRKLLLLDHEFTIAGFHSYGGGFDDDDGQGMEGSADVPTDGGANHMVGLALQLLSLDLARAVGAELFHDARAWGRSLRTDDTWSLRDWERRQELFCGGYVDWPVPFDWWVRALLRENPEGRAPDRQVLRRMLEAIADGHDEPGAGDRAPWATCRALLWLGPDAPPVTPAFGLSGAQLAWLRAEARPATTG